MRSLPFAWPVAALLTVLYGVLAVHAAPPSSAPAAPTAAQRKTLELLALGKARTEALQRIRALPITREAGAGDWVTGSVELDRALRLWVRNRPAEGQVRQYSDAVCEVDVAISPEALRDQLLRLLDEYGAAASVRGVDAAAIQAAAKRWPTLWTTGSAALPEHAVADRPPGWEDVTSTGLDLARQAAEADAYHALLEEAGRLKVTAARRLREFLDSSDAVRNAVYDAVRKESKTSTQFEPDQIAVATVRIGIKDLMRIVTKAHDDQYRGGDFTAADFREMVLLAGRDALSASGLAPPPERTILRNRYAPIELDAPPWAAETRMAVGRFEPSEGESPDAATQYQAARLDALDQLRRKVEALVIQQNVTVAEFVGYHQDLKDDIVLFLNGARVIRRQARPDGGAEVEVELPLRRLWEIVRRDMKLEEVEPAETTTKPASPATLPAPQKENP